MRKLTTIIILPSIIISLYVVDGSELKGPEDSMTISGYEFCDESKHVEGRNPENENLFSQDGVVTISSGTYRKVDSNLFTPNTLG